jgi:fucose permease
MLGFLLFFESGMEGIVNNWTTTYLQHDLKANPQQALFALTYFVMGMTVTRLLLGGLLKKLPAYLVLYGCLTTALAGTLALMLSSSMTIAVAGLVLLGIGFAAGFPVILGYVGDIYSKLSGTAFSIVLVIALLGNMLINYLVGLVSHAFGIKQFTTVLLIAVILMMLLLKFVLGRIKDKTAV